MAWHAHNPGSVGHPVLIPSAGHGGLALHEAREDDALAVLGHLCGLDAEDRRMRFAAAVGDGSLARYVDGMWRRPGFVLAAHDGPVRPWLERPAGPVCALADVATFGSQAEIGLSVDLYLRRQGIGTYLVQISGWLLAPRGVRRLTAVTRADNVALLRLAQRNEAEITVDCGEIEATFDTAALSRSYLERSNPDLAGFRAS